MKANFEKGTKICSRCRKELPINCFNKCKNRVDGLQSTCRNCRHDAYEKYYYRDIEYSREKARNNNKKKIFQRNGRSRGNGGMLKRDYELTEEQLKRRNASRKYRKVNRAMTHVEGILIWYDGKLQDLETKEYRNILRKEYKRQRNCAIRGYVGITQPSEHFLFDFDLEQMLENNAYFTGKRRYYITKWWKGEIRHWTVNDGIWKEG